MCGRGIGSWVRFLPLVECFELLGVGCGGSDQHLEIGVSMKSPKGSAMEGSLVIH